MPIPRNPDGSVDEAAYNSPRRSRFYVVSGTGYVNREIPGNDIPFCKAVHGQPDAEMIVDALNAWQDRHRTEAV